MSNLIVFLHHNGTWENEQYVNYAIGGVLLSKNCTYTEFCNLVFDQLKLNSSTNRLELKYPVKDGYPPMSIYDDDSLAFYAELKSREADYTKFPICVVVEPLIDERDKISYECNVAPLRRIKIEDFLTNEENSMNFMGFAHKVAETMVEEAKYIEDKLYSEMFRGNEDVNYSDIVVGHSFSNKAALQEMISLHAINNHYQFKVEKSCARQYYVKCACTECEWFMRASRVGQSSMFKIRKLGPDHTCSFENGGDAERGEQGIVGPSCPDADEILERVGFEGDEIGNLTSTHDGARKEGKA